MRVVLDEDVCVGHGRCYAIAPEVFDADDQGHCVLRYVEVPEGLRDQARTGVDNCPEGALRTEEDAPPG